MIESINNDRVKYWASLKVRKGQEKYNLFLVEGEHLVEEAYKSGYLEEAIVLEGYDYPYELVTHVSEQVMKKITSLSSPPRIVGVAKFLAPRNIRGSVVMLDGIQDPGNLGTIVRSAVAFGIDTIVLGNGTVSIYNSKVVRATEGLLFNINIIKDDLKMLIPRLQNDGYKVYTTKVDGGQDLRDISFAPKTAVVIGSEASGVKDSIASLCDEFVYIPMNEACESLNAGVATSIILYELSIKQKNTIY